MKVLAITLLVLFISLSSFGQAALSTNVTAVDFGGIAVGGAPISPSGPQRDIVLSNTGNAALTVSNIQTTGDFQLPASLAGILPLQLNPGESRDFAVEFVATVAGPRSGVLTFTDNAPNSPQTVALTGNGLTNDFSLSVQTTPASTTVTAGQAGGYILDLASGAQFSGPVTLTCTGLPTGATFNVVTEGFGTQLNLASTSFLTLSVQIGTTANTTAQNRTKLPLWYTFGAVLGMALISCKRQKRIMPMMVLLMLTFTIVSCGGSSSGPASGPTPAGTFNVVFTATSGTTVHTAPATLIVH
jgi:hypothetical protein